MLINDTARACHEMNKIYCDMIGDKSQKHWEHADKWQRESAINGVIFALKNSDITPEKSHQSWMQQKVIDGWTYGPVKDEYLKEHPCLVAYSQLPKIQRFKDQLFLKVIEAFKAGFSDEIEAELNTKRN